MRAALTCRSVHKLEDAECVCVIPLLHRGRAEIVPILKKDESDPSSWTFTYQHETYVVLSTASPPTFAPIPYPCASSPTLSTYLTPSALKPTLDVPTSHNLYGPNTFDIPIPTFTALFAEHAVAPFFVFQVFCVGLWMLDEYWYYSLFTLFMLVVFECTVVFQRVKTLQEFRTMSVKPYPIQCLRDGKWTVVQTDELYPGDVVSVTRGVDDRSIPADLLLLAGTVIVNEAMLSGESTPLVKESIQLREKDERLDLDGAHKGNVVFGGTKALQCTKGSETDEGPATPDGGALATVLRTGFGTAQGKLVRTMIFSTERVSANNFESFLFIGFLLVFAIAASWYVWVKGIEREMAKGKLLLDCVLIITSVVPPELPMELSLAVNASLVALSKYAIFCTEPFRIPFAGKVDVCCFDKTGTITQESLVLDGVAGVMPGNPRELVPVTKTSPQTVLCLAAAHALVRLEDGTVVGDPMERATLDALEWELDSGKMDVVVPRHKGGPVHRIEIKRRFQFSSALKRMSTVSGVAGRTMVAVKGAPETIRGMLSVVPPTYDETFKWFTRRGARVLALGWKEQQALSNDKIHKMHRDEIESGLTFGGFLVFQCPLKSDAVEVLKMLGDASHRCIMITGDNPLTAVHVAREVEIMDREALILDLKEGATDPRALTWRTVDEQTVIPVDPEAELDAALLAEYDVCITGAALAQYLGRPDTMDVLVQHALVYARVSPAQKESILATLNGLGYCTLMAGDGTNDVGALKAAHVGVALLEGTMDDLKKIAEHQRIERIKSVYESQLKISARFGQAPPPPPPALRDAYPELVQAQQNALQNMNAARQRNPMERFDLASITDRLADMEEEGEVPKIKLGDASCAAPFTSKLSNVSAIAHIIRQGRCTLVATIQMYKILALNCLISAYSLSVQYLDGIKFGDYQVTITGMLMSVCFLFISRAKPVEQLSRERPLTNIFNLYVVLSVLLQFAVHIAALLYITDLSNRNEDRGAIDLEAKFEPSLLNTAVYLLSLSQQVSTFAINFQGRPFREGIRENPALYYGLLGASAVAFSGATDFMPEMNRWLQIVEMVTPFKIRLTSVMVGDFVLCFIIEHGCKALFADLRPREFIERGMERRLRRRAVEREEKRMQLEIGAAEKKTQ
ncbi:putative ATPase [Exidia glandulosa HHB12029]|uniref:Putative ATPase n=1 Tax=Exidia glandulosa HHB12029 TaxID=1314781 RepID=A0A165NZM3_EXIGL|nr:putative ATPase [Exidia glandulosa HHB12029]